MLLFIRKTHDSQGEKSMAFYDFWTAPEILRANHIFTPNESSDVYSLAVVLHEIFTREDPYFEELHEMTADDVINAVKMTNIRPRHGDNTPLRVRQIIEIAWSDEPASRPSFEQIHTMLQNANPFKKSVLDNIMEAMEEYTQHLEEQLDEANAELGIINKNMLSMIPKHLSEKVFLGQAVIPQVHDLAGFLVIKVCNFIQLSSVIAPKNFITLLNELLEIIDETIAKQEAYLVESRTGHYAIVSGTVDKDTPNNVGILVSIGMKIIERTKSIQSSLLKGTIPSDTHSKLDSMIEKFDISWTNGGQNGKHNFCLLHPKVCIAIHSGPLVTGLCGYKVPRFVVFGDVVEVTWLLLNHSKPYNILLSQCTTELLRALGGFNTSKATTINLQVCYHFDCS